ncbi:hypothetical protein ACFYXF_20995 [Streptomyces sp. NPDC002680]|uniref:hypothetical protein n=1 Tax=Streptomyces sp. NPDC002680 TaxID=3364659 RepID=UPI0036C9483E
MSPAVNRSLLETVESAFHELAADPNPLTLDGALLGQGVSSGPLPLDEVRSRLLECSEPEVRDAVWRAITNCAHGAGDRDRWLLAAIGVMLPGLRGISRRQAWGTRRDWEDLDSEVVVAFLAELERTDPRADGLAQRLWWAAFRGAIRARRQDQDATRHLVPDLGESLPAQFRAPSHPDLALVRLREEGVISEAEGDLIGRTRLEGEPLAVAAQRLGISYQACSKRRGRAERRVAEHLARTATGSALLDHGDDLGPLLMRRTRRKQRQVTGVEDMSVQLSPGPMAA